MSDVSDAIVVSCDCGNSHEFAREYVGRVAKCPHLDRRFMVPKQSGGVLFLTEGSTARQPPKRPRTASTVAGPATGDVGTEQGPDATQPPGDVDCPGCHARITPIRKKKGPDGHRLGVLIGCIVTVIAAFVMFQATGEANLGGAACIGTSVGVIVSSIVVALVAKPGQKSCPKCGQTMG